VQGVRDSRGPAHVGRFFGPELPDQAAVVPFVQTVLVIIEVVAIAVGRLIRRRDEEMI
jgi:hypothetical protein